MNSDIVSRLEREARRNNIIDLARSIGSVSLMMEEPEEGRDHDFDEEYVSVITSFWKNIGYLKCKLSNSMLKYVELKNKNELHRQRLNSFESILNTFVECIYAEDGDEFKKNELQIIEAIKKILEIMDNDTYKDSILLEKKALAKFNSIRKSLNVLEDTSPFICGTCYDDVNGVCLSPCGHMTCNTCAPNFSRCPFCRSNIDKKIRLFQS